MTDTETRRGKGRFLIIVARDQPALCDYLTRDFVGDEEVQVILDRRRGERHEGAQAHEPARPEPERRRQPGIEQDLRSRSVVIVRGQSQ